MKMIMIIYNEAIEEDVAAVLESSFIESFTKWQKVLGKGRLSQPHLDSNVWPGTNNVCMAVVEDDRVNVVLGKVKKLREVLGKEGIKAFVLPVEEAT